MKSKSKSIVVSTGKKICLLFFGLALIILFEKAAIYFLPDSELNIAESISMLCKEDSLLLWRQRCALKVKFCGKDVRTNDLGLRGDNFFKKKQPGVNRIICMGASSTFGWGVEEGQTYPYLLAKNFNESQKDDKVEVLNAGQIGFTTFQGKIFLEKYILNYAPDIITVSYVLNDIDRCRFFRNEKKSDNELRLLDPWKVFLKNIIIKSRIYLLGKRGLEKLAWKNEKFSTYVLLRQYENAKIRVSIEQYRDNLIEIALMCRANDIDLIFLKMPVHLMQPKLTKEETLKVLSGSPLSDYFYEQGCFYQVEGNYKEAIVNFKKARDYQAIECQLDGALYQKVMSEVAREHEVVMVDISKLFEMEKDMDILFNGALDPIHPSGIGHGIIARALHGSINDNGFLK